MAEDKDIFYKIKRGDKTAFEILFRELYPSLCVFANKYIHDMVMAEEIVQEVFFKMWMKRKDINIKHDIRPYMFTSVKNKCLVYIQHQKVKEEYARVILHGAPPLTFDVEDYLGSVELEKMIDQTLDSFPDRMRNIFILSRYEGLKYQEIAGKLKISVKTVEANITKALKIFKRNLGEYINLQPGR